MRMERRYGPFSRSLNLPSSVDADRVRAAYRNGVLEIKLPKRPGDTSDHFRGDCVTSYVTKRRPRV